MNTEITAVTGRQVWDSRGRPTIEAEVHLAQGSIGRAIAPAGASTGSGEAVDLRDGGSRFGGFGVNLALSRLHDEIAPMLIGNDAIGQEYLDGKLLELDGTGNFSRLGGNATIAVSLALANAAAAALGLPLWRYLSGPQTPALIPVPEVQIFGGGAHASGQIDLQDFMVVPYGASSFREALEWVAEIYLAAGARLGRAGQRFGVADEGGYWPSFGSNTEAISTLFEAINDAGFDPSCQVGISIDVAATQLFDGNGYQLRSEARSLTMDEWFAQIEKWLREWPIVMIEDPFHEKDMDAHARLVARHGDRVQIIGDDLLVTSSVLVEEAARKGACTALLCKPNQAGTLSLARAAFAAARDHQMGTIVSARSGESEDVALAHLAVGWRSGQVKVGSFTRSERMAKWNELLRIEDTLGKQAVFAGGNVFGRH